MGDMSKMMDEICNGLNEIAEKGLTTTNLERAYKLVDMYKDMKTVEAMDEAGYSETMSYGGDYPMSMRGNSYRDDGDSMARGRGRNARRDSMGRYSRNSMNEGRSYADERYSEAKRNYRTSRAGKDDVMSSLEEKMNELKMELQEMSRDSDFPEERQMIDKYVNMINKAMQ